MLKEQMKRLSEQDLRLIERDSMERIASHSVAGTINPHYVSAQRTVIDAVAEELRRRRERHVDVKV